jgi:fibronectin type 3 domain-containing protein
VQISKHLLVNLLFVNIFSLVLNSCVAENSLESLDLNVQTTPPSNVQATSPSNVQATAGEKQNTLSWTAVTGADSYNIYQSERTIDDISDVGPSVNVTTTTETITGLTNGTEYHYVVTAQKGSTESIKSTEITATPILPATAPINVQATAGYKQNTLSWTAVTGADSYNIYQSESTIDDISDVAPSVNVTTTTETITGLTNGTEYHYVVTAKKGDIESTKSTEVTATPVLPATFTESYGSIDFVKVPKGSFTMGDEEGGYSGSNIERPPPHRNLC